MEIARILCTDLAGLRAQALGLAEAAGLVPDVRTLDFRRPWGRVPPALWMKPRWAVKLPALAQPLPGVVIGCGGAGARLAAYLRSASVKAVAVQNPRIALSRFDVVLAARHDGISGSNVIVTRTALHRATPARLAEAARVWEPRLRHLRRPLVAVLLGGSNGRFRLDEAVATRLANQLAVMTRNDRVSLAITPSRRTDPAARAIIADTLEPFGAWMWDMQGENPYFGLLALADAIIVTIDSVSMVSEAVATRAPVMLAPLPGRSRRIFAFLDALLESGRVRNFGGRCEIWPVEPVDDTPVAAFAMRRRLGF